MTTVNRMSRVAISGLVGALLLAGCATSEYADGPAGVERREDPVMSQVGKTGTCGADGPTFESVEAAVAESRLIVRGVATIVEEESSVPGSAGVPGWEVQVTGSWSGEVQVGETVEVVAPELIPGTERCFARFVEGAESYFFLSNEHSTQSLVYYPIVVMIETDDGRFVDADLRIEPAEGEEIAAALDTAGLSPTP